MCSPELHRNPLNRKLIAYCANPPVSQILKDIPYGNKVIRLSDDEIIKFDINITGGKNRELKRTINLVDNNIVRAPRAYRFFKNGSSLGYLIIYDRKGYRANIFVYSYETISVVGPPYSIKDKIKLLRPKGQTGPRKIN
jgi:hypothetical protein